MVLRVILADDHRLMREGLRGLLSKQADIDVVAEAVDGRTTLKLVKEFLPDVVIMDIAMPDLNGIEATRQITATFPNVKVIGLSMYSDRRFVSGMLSGGASGYLLKDCAFEELVNAIHTVMGHHIYLSPSIVDVMVKSYAEHLLKTEPSSFSILTSREREILQLIAEGKTTKGIANHLTVSIKTVETHRQQIMRKLNINSLADLIKYAIREGLTSL
ncbi:response regulator [Chloroflexota bacterium]